MTDEKIDEKETEDEDEEDETEKTVKDIPPQDESGRVHIFRAVPGKNLFVVRVNGEDLGKCYWKWEDIESAFDTPKTGRQKSFPKIFTRTNASVGELKAAMQSVPSPSIKNISDNQAKKNPTPLPLPTPNIDDLEDMFKKAKIDDNPKYTHVSFADALEVGMCTAICAGFPYEKDPPWVIVQGPPSCGKEFLSDFLKNEQITKEGMKTTKNALNPGRANDAVDTKGTFQVVNGRMWMNTEMGVYFRDEESAGCFLFELLGQYGKNYSICDDPTGENRKPTYFTTFFCGTTKMIEVLSSQITVFGPRYLIIDMYSRRRKVKRMDPKLHQDIMDLVTSIVLDRKKKELPKVDTLVSDQAFNFACKFTILRSAGYASSPEKAEDTPRIQMLLETCARLRALLYERKPTVDDVNWWARFIYPTIGHRDVWFRIRDNEDAPPRKRDEENWDEIIRKNLLKVGVLVDPGVNQPLEFDPYWKTFVEHVLGDLTFALPKGYRDDEGDPNDLIPDNVPDDIDGAPADAIFPLDEDEVGELDDKTELPPSS